MTQYLMPIQTRRGSLPYGILKKNATKTTSLKKKMKKVTKSVVAAKPEKEVDSVLADASHRSLKLVQDVPQLRDGVIQRNETKANSPRIKNPIKGSTSFDHQYIQAVRRLKKRYLDLFVIGGDQLTLMKGIQLSTLLFEAAPQ